MKDALSQRVTEDRTRPDERSNGHSRVAHELAVQRFVQPDDVTCGPTCLRKVYDFYGITAAVDDITRALEQNPEGGTLAVFLGISALQRGFHARIFPYDLRIFDPTWYDLSSAALAEKIFARLPLLKDAKRLRAASAYVRYLELGGELGFEDLTPRLLKSIIDREHPVLAGLSATYLYGFPRERWDPDAGRLVDDDIAGEPIGHFVVIKGYDQWGRRLTVLDPSEHVPAEGGRGIVVDSDRLINAIMLGDATYDAVLLEIWPKEQD
jgi:hypothetical protein